MTVAKISKKMRQGEGKSGRKIHPYPVAGRGTPTPHKERRSRHRVPREQQISIQINHGGYTHTRPLPPPFAQRKLHRQQTNASRCEGLSRGTGQLEWHEVFAHFH